MRLVFQLGYTHYALPKDIFGVADFINVLSQIQQVEKKYTSGVGHADVFTPTTKPNELEIKFVPESAFEGEAHESTLAGLVKDSEKKATDLSVKLWTLEDKLKKYEQKYGAEV